MLATAEGFAREEGELAQRKHELTSVGDVTQAAKAAVSKGKNKGDKPTKAEDKPFTTADIMKLAALM
jgi:hypothetical protein